MKRAVKFLIGQRNWALLRARVLHYRSLWHRRDLTRLALLHGSDKAGVHFYTQHYQRFFGAMRARPLRLLEIGVGGYDDPQSGGSSLRMWKYFFPQAEIFSLDIEDKTHLAEERITIFQGSQNDGEFLERVMAATGPLDIIVDDGSHRNEDVVFSFEKLFPALKPGGWYVVEDTQTSYWPEYGGNSQDLVSSPTTMNYFKGLLDGLNYAERLSPCYTPSFLDRNITSLHFFHNLIFVQRGANEEPSNRPLDG